MNLFDFAMKMELDGKEYYQRLAEAAAAVGLKSIFTHLAEDEQKHYDMIQAMKAGNDGKMAETTILKDMKNLFQVLRGDKSIVYLEKDLDAYRHAMKIEAKSVKFYEDLAKKEQNPEVVQLLLQIANEEKKHFIIMENIHDFVQAPQNFMAWGEFGNLKEL